MSVFSKLVNQDSILVKLSSDLETGEWHKRNRKLLTQSEHDCGYRIIVAELTG